MWSSEETGEVAGTSSESGQRCGDARRFASQAFVNPREFQAVAEKPHLGRLSGLEFRSLDRHLEGVQQDIVEIAILPEDPLSGLVF